MYVSNYKYEYLVMLSSYTNHDHDHHHSIFINKNIEYSLASNNKLRKFIKYEIIEEERRDNKLLQEKQNNKQTEN